MYANKASFPNLSGDVSYSALCTWDIESGICKPLSGDVANDPSEQSIPVVITVVVVIVVVVVLLAAGVIVVILLYRRRASLRREKADEPVDRKTSEMEVAGSPSTQSNVPKKRAGFYWRCEVLKVLILFYLCLRNR
jgi:hypothetical protein